MVTCVNCGLSKEDEVVVKRKLRLNLEPGRYRLKLFYEKACVNISGNFNGNIKIEEIPSPENSGVWGKMLILQHEDVAVKLTCSDKIPVASILSGCCMY